VDAQRIPLIIEPDLDDPDCAEVMVDGTIAGRPYRFMLDTGAARTQIVADDLTAALPSRGQHSSSGVFAASNNALVEVFDLAVGPLAVPAIEVERFGAPGPGARNLLGMDVLRHRCCHFRFDSGDLLLEHSPAVQADRVLQMDDSGHVYVNVELPGATGRACWDSGAGITIVDLAFQLRYPGLFERSGTSAGTDATGTQVQVPIFLITAPTIGGVRFQRHKVAVVDLSQTNSALDRPMDLVLGYPTLRQADWLFDFPASRWTITRRPDEPRS
jgi:predicted aspartyl protease